MLYSIDNKSSSRCELKNIKKIKAKASKKFDDYSSDSSRNKSYYDSSLSSGSDWDEERQPAERREINRSDHVVTNNIKTNSYQRYDAMENEPKFENSFNLSRGTKKILPVVTVSLRGGKKKIAMTAAGLICLWDSGVTNSMIKRRHTKYYERKMQ